MDEVRPGGCSGDCGIDGSWRSPSATRSFVLGDPILDWLDRHGAAAGLERDDAGPRYDPRTDMGTFVREKGRAFEAGVLALLQPHGLVRLGEARSRSCEAAARTREAMRMGAPLIAGGVLHDPVRRVHGRTDLLVRADVLERILPGSVPPDELGAGAPALGTPWHYRVIEIKYATLALRADGSCASDHEAHAVQALLYDLALGALQGFTPSCAHLLGRAWQQGRERGLSCLERLARVPLDGAFGDRPIAATATAALAWLDRLAADGAGWQVLPEASVPELRPNLRNAEDAPWHGAKVAIAAATGELTRLPTVSATLRDAALAAGVRRWDEPGLTAASLGVKGPVLQARLDRVLEANRPGGLAERLVVVPEQMALADPAFRTEPPIEFFVDFETVSNLDDHLARLPLRGGQALIFQIGCGHWERTSEGRTWRFAQWTTDRLDEDCEAAIIDAWVAHMQERVAARGATLADARVVHWSAAEVSTLEGSYESARARRGCHWPVLPWFDALTLVARADPMGVRGAFGWGLKAIAKAMHAAGLIETVWREGPADGLGAMVGAWWCDREARRLGVPMTELDLMRSIGAYNEVDCRSMAEIVGWLREHR